MSAAGSRPLVLAHRGDARAAPENSMAAFDAALRAGLDGCETDVRLAGDGSLVLIHDARLADGRRVADLDRRALGAALGHEVPVVDDVLDRHPTAFWNLEVKVAAAAPALLERLARRDPERVLVTSFDHVAAARFAEAAVPAGVLIAHRPLAGATPFAAWRRRGLRTLVLPFAFLDALLADEARAEGVDLGVWGVATEAERGVAEALGARIVIVD